MSTEIPDSPSQKWGRVLPGIAIAFSVFSLVLYGDLRNISSFIVSLVGIAAGVMFFMRKPSFRTLLLIWIYAQFPAISRITPAGDQPLLDAGQFLTIKVGFTLSGTRLYFNMVPLAYLALYHFLLVAGVAGKRVVITSFLKVDRFGVVR